MLFKVNVVYEFSDDDLVYVIVFEGYWCGGSNGVLMVGNFVNDEEWLFYEFDEVMNYEFGFKGILVGVRYDLSVFYIDWDNI